VKARLVALYESSNDPTTVSVLFGSSTLSDMLGRLDAAQTIATADHNLAVETTAARARYARAERRTRSIEQRRASAVRQLNSQRQRIESMLAQRRQLLSSVRSQIAALKAQEARRQAILAAQARARLVHEQALLRQQAAARAAVRRRALPEPDPAAPPTSTAPGPSNAPTPAPANLVGGHPEAATMAMRYLGVPYVWGGSTPAGFDCSGLVMYVYAQLGISLPHYAAAQYGYGTAVPSDQLQPGDLVFFDGLGHVGIYIGGGQMIHAPHTGDVVKISPLTDFGSGYVGARRL
jgi:cell wall-associated NlpC family hydrolase